ncbi:MAG: hypothetical protein Q7R47_00055, partial [Candidatus Diapherotrites archaeon]|nr:hypothetical protein [Candidatus Diapherotrites archaeon]
MVAESRGQFKFAFAGILSHLLLDSPQTLFVMPAQKRQHLFYHRTVFLFGHHADFGSQTPPDMIIQTRRVAVATGDDDVDARAVVNPYAIDPLKARIHIRAVATLWNVAFRGCNFDLVFARPDLKHLLDKIDRVFNVQPRRLRAKIFRPV